MSRPKEALRAQKLQQRPKSVGWNPFNNTLNQSVKRRRRRSGSKNSNGSNSSLSSTKKNSINNSSSGNNSNNNTTSPTLNSNSFTNHFTTNSALEETAAKSPSRERAASKHFTASELSHMPDDKVWENLSTMSLRDLAAGHHCVPIPPKQIPAAFIKHLKEVNRLESQDKHQKMMNRLAKREESRWRLANRKRERIAIQEYCSQPVLHIPDPTVEMNVSEPLTVGQVLRSKYHKTHPKPSYNVRLHRKLQKSADVRALRMIINRFDRSEQHEEHVAAIKNYTRNMSRGNLRVAAMKRSELETRLGTPFALSGVSIFAKPSTADGSIRRSRRRGRGDGVRLSASAGAFGVGAFDTPSGVAKPGNNFNMLSMPVLHPIVHPSDEPQTDSAMQQQPQQSQQQPLEQPKHLSPAINSGGSEISIGPKPIWQRDPHEHWKPPSHHLRYLERAATSPGHKRARGGFPNKYLYPIEISGLNTLFPE
jgi:hypothetical protein